MKVMLVSMLPIVEVKGAIPMGMLWGMNGWEAFAAAIIGSSIPVPFIMWLLKPALRWLRSLPYKPCHVYADWFENRAMKKKGRISEKSLIFLFLFVAIPIPTTGVWMRLGHRDAAGYKDKICIAYYINRKYSRKPYTGRIGRACNIILWTAAYIQNMQPFIHLVYAIFR